MENKLNLIFAIKEGSLVSISEVERGLACNCICPACGEKLVAKKGVKRAHHFAHRSGGTCAFGYETSLHLLAKDILSNAKKMTIPAVFVSFPESNKAAEVISPPKEIEIDSVALEMKYNDVIPDIAVYTGKKVFFVEIYVTHRVDEAKLEKLRKDRISTIEIDISRLNREISREELTCILIQDSNEKQWKYNKVSEKYSEKFLRAAEKKNISFRGATLHVDNCPINARSWHGRSYANYYDDCLSCRYCISASGTSLLCSGRELISTVADFSKTIEERRNDFELKRVQSHESSNSLHNYSKRNISTSDHSLLLPQEEQELKIGKKDVSNRNFEEETPILDRYNRRWFICRMCKQLTRKDKMVSYGGSHKINEGICRACSRKIEHIKMEG